MVDTDVISIASQGPETRNAMWKFNYGRGASCIFTDTENRTTMVDFHELLYEQHPFSGRGMRVARATILAVTTAPDDHFDCTDMIGREYIFRFSWKADSYTSEAVRMVTEEDEYMNDHRPEAVAWAVLQRTNHSPRGGGVFQHVSPHTELERRPLEILPGALQPITVLTLVAEVKTAFRQIASCHGWLVRVSQILHRDISVNNLMLRRKLGSWFAVLTDFELAIPINLHEKPGRPSHCRRTGTMPFMAIDLLHGDEDLYARHDLEALYWTFVWLTVRYHDGKCLTARMEADENGNPRIITIPVPLDKWLKASMDDLYHYKVTWIVRRGSPATRNFLEFDRTWGQSLRKLFGGGLQQQDWYAAAFAAYLRRWEKWELSKAEVDNAESSTPPPEPVEPDFDKATQSGVVTWEAFYECMQG